MDRTVLPGNPAGEAADGVVGAEDLASTADRPARVSKGRVNRDSGKVAIKPRAAAKAVIRVAPADPIAKNSANSAPGQ